MDLATSHVGTDLDGLAALVAVALLEGPLELGLPGSLDPAATRFYRDHAAALAPLLSDRDLRARLDREPLGRLVVVDTARRDRLGFIAGHVDRFASVIAYDTHGGAQGDLPRVALPDAGACVSPLVLRLARRGVTPTPAQAGLFLLGIHSDTGHFTFPGTTARDHRAAAQCLAWGAPLEWVAEYTPRGLDRHRLHLMERMAAHAQRLVVRGQPVTLTTLDLDEYEPDLAPLLDELRRAEGWRAAFLIASDPRRTSFIGRSSGALDVAAVLRQLGGGGHPEAASAALRACPLPEARAMLIDALEHAATGLTAGDLASSPVYDLPADATVEAAAAALHRYRVNALPLTRDGAYVGMVSRREVDDALRHGLGGAPVSAVSVSPPERVAPDADLATVRRTLLSSPGRLVLVGRPDEAPLGVLTRSDVFRSAALDPPLAGARRPPPRERMWAALAEALGDDLARVEALGALAEEAGERLFLVGGAVRDVLLERRVEDLDLVVVGHAPALGERAVARLGGHLHVHEAFETCTWVTPDGRRVDLTTARTESYRAPGALPDVARGGLRHDLMRRDFTINAMALEVGPSRAGELVDPFGGQADLQERVLRVLHGLSFHDDPTRAWRAARFAGRFDFRLAPGTQSLLKEALRAGFLSHISPERLGHELHKLLEEPHVARCVAMLRAWHLLAPIHPALQTDHGLLDRVHRTREAWVRYATLADTAVGPGEPQWIALGWDLPPPDRRALKRLTARARGRTRLWVAGPGRVREAVKRLAKAGRRSEVAAAFEGLDAAELIAAMALGGDEATAHVEWWEREGRHVRPALNGRDLIVMGVPEGAAVGRGLQAARAAALDGGDEAAQRAAALSAARETR